MLIFCLLSIFLYRLHTRMSTGAAKEGRWRGELGEWRRAAAKELGVRRRGGGTASSASGGDGRARWSGAHMTVSSGGELERGELGRRGDLPVGSSTP